MHQRQPTVHYMKNHRNISKISHQIAQNITVRTSKKKESEETFSNLIIKLHKNIQCTWWTKALRGPESLVVASDIPYDIKPP